MSIFNTAKTRALSKAELGQVVRYLCEPSKGLRSL